MSASFAFAPQLDVRMILIKDRMSWNLFSLAAAFVFRCFISLLVVITLITVIIIIN